MNIEAFREYCLSKAGSSESFPFDEDTLVFKVGSAERNKLFALASLRRQPQQVNLKCDPERAINLREQYPSILPGYHMNKKHWNTIILEREVSATMIKALIDHSYELVLSSLPKSIQKNIKISD